MGLIPKENTSGRTLIIVEAVVAFLALVVVCLRVWARRLKGVKLNLSDWLCISALIFAFALLSTIVYDVVQGLGLPLEHAKPEQLVGFNKSILAGLFLWTASITLIRLSILFLYVRVFPVQKFILICRMFMVCELGYAIATYVTGLTICKPIGSFWGPSVEGRHCGDREALFLWHGVQNLIYDVLLVGLPMPLVWRLQLPLYKRVSLIGIFGLGFCICAITLSRVVLTSVANIDSISQGYVTVALLTMLEPLLGVINCSLPLLRPVIHELSTRAGIKNAFASGDDRASAGLYQEPSNMRRATRAKNPYSIDMDTIPTLAGSSQSELHTPMESSNPESESSVYTAKREMV
ncbi:hypothetical protein J1614_010254 [Plenodomus biglobosus]|nr:hypothetical protein J1614_010254 [Plenodomus biglobosus]